MNSNNQTKENQQTDLLEETSNVKNLVLYNDEINSFDWVITCLMEVCKFTKEQAEQCTLIVHLKEKSIIRSGALDVLQPEAEALSERGLTVDIQ